MDAGYQASTSPLNSKTNNSKTHGSPSWYLPSHPSPSPCPNPSPYHHHPSKVPYHPITIPPPLPPFQTLPRLILTPRLDRPPPHNLKRQSRHRRLPHLPREIHPPRLRTKRIPIHPAQQNRGLRRPCKSVLFVGDFAFQVQSRYEIAGSVVE